jgi:hypothetical protein
MSLEESILALARAVEENTAIMKFINEGGYRLREAPETGTNAQLEEVAQKAEAIGNSIVIKDLPNDKPKSQPTPDTSPASSNESAPVTYDDVKRITIKVSEVSRDKAKAALSRFGVASAKVLPADSWGGYVSYMGKVLSGEIDPEASHE